MSVRVQATAIPAVRIVAAPRHGDSRGFFAETYSHRDFAAAGIATAFVQDNHSRSAQAGTVRGLHFQIGASVQDKLVRVVRGAILDVAVDLRRGSPSYGAHVAVTLSAEDSRQLFVPAGFAHGFCTLEAGTEVIYKTSAYYAPEQERGLRWDDPALGIAWPVAAAEATLSERDRLHPVLADLPAYFA